MEQWKQITLNLQPFQPKKHFVSMEFIRARTLLVGDFGPHWDRQLR